MSTPAKARMTPTTPPPTTDAQTLEVTAAVERAARVLSDVVWCYRVAGVAVDAIRAALLGSDQ